jgi:hypothetical protein
MTGIKYKQFSYILKMPNTHVKAIKWNFYGVGQINLVIQISKNSGIQNCTLLLSHALHA